MNNKSILSFVGLNVNKKLLEKLPFLTKEEIGSNTKLQDLQDFMLKKIKPKKLENNMQIISPEKLAMYFIANFPVDQESFHVVLLNNKQHVIKDICLGLGSSDLCVIDFHKLVRESILNNASSVVLIHNHPSNDPTPSLEDITTTKDIVNALGYNHIKVVDHIVIGTSPLVYYSFARQYKQALEFKLKVSPKGVIL